MTCNEKSEIILSTKIEWKVCRPIFQKQKATWREIAIQALSLPPSQRQILFVLPTKDSFLLETSLMTVLLSKTTPFCIKVHVYFFS